MDTDKITKFYEEAINIISNASENSKNEFADYLIGYYTNLSANKLIECDITKDEAMEIANKIKAYKEEQKFDTEKEDMRVTRTVESIIYSTEKMNLDDALKHIQKEIDKYNNYELKDGKRFNKNDAGSVKEIVRKLELYKQGLIDDYEKFKTLDEAVNGHIKYAETLGLDERIGYIDKAIDYYYAIDYYNNTSLTKEDKAYITKRLNAYKNTLEEKLNNKDDKNKENKESKIKVVGKRVCKWISKHKRQILIGVGCAVIATGLFAISASAIPTLMAANSANWWIAKSVGNVALMNTLHANNIALGAKIGAVFAAKTGTWTISAGSIIGKSALVSSVAGISGFSVSSIVSALHKKFVPKTNSNGEEVISKEEAKIYYDNGYRNGLKKGRNETNDREYNDGYDDGYNDALEDIEKEGNVDESSNDKNKTSFQTLRNTFSKLFNRTKKKNDDEEWEPIVSTSNNNDDIWTIAHRAGGYYIENSKKADIDAEIMALKDKLVDTLEKEKDWELGFKAGIDDYNKINMPSEYLDLEQLNNLNPGANITFDELHPYVLYSDIDADLLTLPNGWYYNDKNGITNKHNTETGVYQTYTVEKYQEDRDKPSSHKR